MAGAGGVIAAIPELTSFAADVLERVGLPGGAVEIWQVPLTKKEAEEALPQP